MKIFNNNYKINYFYYILKMKDCNNYFVFIYIKKVVKFSENCNKMKNKMKKFNNQNNN